MTDPDTTQPQVAPPVPEGLQPQRAPALRAAWAPPPADRLGVPVPPAGTVLPTALDVPLARVASAPRRRSPLRWVAAILVVALVAAAGLSATLLLTSSTSGTSTVLGYVPADTLVYGEVRLDLPGGQRAEVAKSLAAFPGFADQASLDSKLGELYDRIIKAATSGKHDYQTQIAPWFGGQLAVAEGPQGFASVVAAGASAAPSATPGLVASLPPCSGGDSATPAASASSASGDGATGTLSELQPRPRFLLLADVKDSAKAQAWVGSIVTETSTATADRTCDGVVVHVVQSSTDSHGNLVEAAWAVLDNRVLVAGDLDSIRLAIATKGAGGLSATPNFQRAVAALPGDHVGFMYEALREALTAQSGSPAALGTDGTLTALVSVLGGMLPEWIAGDLKAADGNVVLDTVHPATDVEPTANRASDLAGLAPPNTIALVDVHDLGKTLGAIKDAFAADPTLQPSVKRLDTILGLAGGFAGTIGLIGDAGFAVTSAGSTVSGGVLIRPDDADAAAHLFTQLRSLVGLAGAGSQISIHDEPYKSATITTVDLSALAPLLTSSVPGGAGAMTIPSDLALTYAVTDKLVVLTLDPSFAKAVIDASQGGDSLAKNTRFSALLAKAGDSMTGLAWVDVTATRGLIENMLPPDQQSRYASDIKPYLLPLDAVISNGAYDNGLDRGTMVVSINH